MYACTNIQYIHCPDLKDVSCPYPPDILNALSPCVEHKQLKRYQALQTSKDTVETTEKYSVDGVKGTSCRVYRWTNNDLLSEAKTEIGILKQENIELQQKLESAKEALTSTQRRLRYEQQSKAEEKLSGNLECNLSPE